MASDHYTPVKPAQNAQGQTADADDVNSVSNAVETAFETLEAEVDALGTDISGWSDLAQEWAEQDEDVNITGEPAGSYSAKHYSIKADASATTASASESAASTSENNASASASNASASETAAAGSADSAEYWSQIMGPQILDPNNQSGSYTLVAGDGIGKVVRMTSNTAVNLTIPPDVFDDYYLIPVIQAGSGQVTLVEGSGVTINTPPGFQLKTRALGAGLTLHLVDVDNNIWDLVGDLEFT